MDRALKRFVEIQGVLRRLRASRKRPKETFSDATIVLVYYLSVLNNQSRAWACLPRNWPVRMPASGLPSESQFSRRINSPGVAALLDKVERCVREIDAPPKNVVRVDILDARPLPVGPHSHDRHAGYGRAAGGKAKGYKLHALIDAAGRLVRWRLAPMNVDEREMARRMLKDLGPDAGYVLADANYDSSKLFATARERGLQLVAPRRQGKDKGLGHHRHDPARLRCRDLLENTQSEFGRELHARRGHIERIFGTAASTPELLTHLPAWVRGRRRVHRWVQAKLVLAELHRIDLARREIRVA